MDNPLDSKLWMYEVEQGKVAQFMYSQQLNTLIAIDPGHPTISLQQCQLLEEELKCSLGYIFITHEHTTHTAGIQSLKRYKNNNVKVFASKYGSKIKGVNQILNNRASVKVGELTFASFLTPGHTPDSLSYMVYLNELDDEYSKQVDTVFKKNMHPDNQIEIKKDKAKLLEQGQQFEV